MTDDDLETIGLRPAVVDGVRRDDDFEVIWRDLPIGRILKQPDNLHWWWGCNVYGQLASSILVCADGRNQIGCGGRTGEGDPAGPFENRCRPGGQIGRCGGSIGVDHINYGAAPPEFFGQYVARH